MLKILSFGDVTPLVVSDRVPMVSKGRVAFVFRDNQYKEGFSSHGATLSSGPGSPHCRDLHIALSSAPLGE